MKQGRSLSKEFKMSSSTFWREESCSKNCKLFHLNICHSCFLYFAARAYKKFSQVVQPSLLCCDGLFEIFLLCDWLFRTVGLQAQNSASTAELLFLGTNQNEGNIIDFKMV